MAKFLFTTTCLVAFCLLASLVGCQQTKSARLHPSESILPWKIADFQAYRSATREWLTSNRIPVTDNLQQEIEMNLPFECKPQGKAVAGVLFVHGLGDSPYFFNDVGEYLCDKGYWVRAILLPGHGSKPGDMLKVSYNSWQQIVDYQVAGFAKKVDRLLLAGFSTGANLATITAFEREDIEALLLFSPAFESSFAYTWLAPYITSVYPWPNVEPEDNPTRYNSMAMQGFAAYQQSVDVLADKFDERALEVPAFMVVAQEDSVVDVDRVAEYFERSMTSPHKRLYWLGSDAPDINGMEKWPMPIAAQRIGAASHMSVMFKPDNPLYGADGSIRICDNGQSEEKTQQCEDEEKVWYGPWGFTEEEKVYARLTYNPYYDKMLRRLGSFLSTL
ncbi:alpha/beta fold hydrolase [Alteromonas pelagimontana]|uniref:Alpha/beta fold hydrolase n=1 Tax=Alteromonas pelagimontana TaxID=1858656 RepID=A0A6M4MB67_9ALTE|nr:alpha/beta fold hydrolase [Alteromonas pelagimontana]QJR79850.1 alpha/beta fold hydrolase [Alteromonas pelagimontana]